MPINGLETLRLYGDVRELYFFFETFTAKIEIIYIYQTFEKNNQKLFSSDLYVQHKSYLYLDITHMRKIITNLSLF